MPRVLAQDLRNAVLQAAIQGKLTIQLKTDTAADSSYLKIKKKKTELINNSLLKKSKQFSDIDEDEIPFDIPDNWIWVRMNDISIRIGDGLHGTPHFSDVRTNFPFINGNNLVNYKITVKPDTKYVDENEYNKYKIDLSNNTIFLSLNGTVGNIAFYNSEQCVLGKSAGYIDTFEEINKHYLSIFLKSMFFLDYSSSKATKTTITNLGLEAIRKCPFPLPPIEEQARIVARVDELMAKIDEYEKIEKEFSELQKAFPSNMKDAILQAAMQGKLTEQLESDGNAFLLAQTIKEERSILGKNKYVTTTEEDVDLPDSWAWIKSGECFGLEKGTKVSGVKLPYLEAKYLRGKAPATYYDEGEMVSKGTKVILVDGENSGEVFTEPEDGIIGSTFKVLFIPKSINEKYALYFLDMNREKFRNNKKGAAIPHLSKELFNDLQLPIPPIEEQQRIVDKLDQLLPLCEQLERMAA